MPKRNNSSSSGLSYFKHHLIPSTVGGGVAYLLSGVVVLGLGVFASVWIANMISHHLHKGS